MDDSRAHMSLFCVCQDDNIFRKAPTSFLGKKSTFWVKNVRFFLLFGHIRARISKVKVSKWMIVSGIGQVFEFVVMKIFSEASNFIFGSKKEHFGSKMCFFVTFWSYKGKNIQS